VQVVRRACPELRNEVEVEVAGIARPDMDKQTSTSDVGRQIKESSNNVLEKAGAQTPTFMVGVDTEPGEKCDGLGITSCALAETLRCSFGTDLCHAPGVVGNNERGALFGDNEDTSRSGACGLVGIVLQPLGLLR
jgi:hypothetical protein